MVYQEYQVSYMRSNNDWKLPLNLAIGFHIMVALTALYLPLLFESKPKFTDVYTVNLVNMSEPAAAPAAAPAPTPPKASPKAPPKMIEKTAAPVKIPPKTQAVPIAETKPVEAAPPAPPKAISLSPVKKKIKNKVVPPDDTAQREREKREKEIERQNRQQLAESLRAEQTAIEEARLAAEEAEAERRLMEATQERLAAIRSQVASSTTGTQASSGPSGGTTNALDAQYAAAVAARIQPFFQLPEIKTFDPSLVTVVVITINSNGEIADTRIEAGSGDAIYDQFVLKSLEAANPLPAIPPALRRQRIELGLKFSPSGIR
jgi:colicin import membrane protein